MKKTRWIKISLHGATSYRAIEVEVSPEPFDPYLYAKEGTT